MTNEEMRKIMELTPEQFNDALNKFYGDANLLFMEYQKWILASNSLENSIFEKLEAFLAYRKSLTKLEK